MTTTFNFRGPNDPHLGASFIPTGSSVPTNGVYLPSANTVGVATNGSGRLFISNSGNVGIGTNNPQAPLHVDGTVIGGSGRFSRPSNFWAGSYFDADGHGSLHSRGSFEVTLSSNGYRNSSNQWTSLGAGGISGAAQLSLAPTGRIDFGVESSKATGSSSVVTTRMQLDQGGLRINQTASNTPGFNNTTTGAAVEFLGGGNGAALFVSRSTGGCAFFNLNSNGDSVSFRRSGVQVGTISVTTTNTSYNTSSDYRLKENVVDLDAAISRLKQLPVHRFNFIADPGTVVDGFLAHEAAEVVPECVTGTKDEVENIGTLTEWNGTVISTDVPEPETLTWEDQVEVTPAIEATYDEEGNELTPAVDAVFEIVTRTRTWEKTGERPVYQGIDQSKIVPLLTQALKDAIKKIEALEARVASLEG